MVPVLSTFPSLHKQAICFDDAPPS